jgi:hypothetical protein
MTYTVKVKIYDSGIPEEFLKWHIILAEQVKNNGYTDNPDNIMNLAQAMLAGRSLEAFLNEKRSQEANNRIRKTNTQTVDSPPSSQPDRALSALTYGLKPSCNLSQSCYGRTPIACAHTTGNSNAHLSQVSYRNLITSQYKQGCNQGEYSHVQVYQKLNTHQLHLNAPYKHLSASVATSPVERTT